MPARSEKHLNAQPYLRKRFGAVGKAMRFEGRSGEETDRWQRKARRKFAELLGLPTMRTCPLRARMTERVDAGDHWRERIEIQVEPGLIMPVYVLAPNEVKGPLPVVIAAHGHGGGGKRAVANVPDSPAMEAAIARYNYAYGPVFCRAGFITFCPEARGFGERQEALSKADPLLPSCQWLNHMAMPLGQTVGGMWVWDLMRLLDYVETRKDCDTKRIGCAGLSGGGNQAMWLAALDLRVKATINSGFFYGYKEALFDKYHNCSCCYVPHLWENFDMGDIGGLVAPRPLLIQSGTEDTHNGASGMKNVESQMRLARKVYRAFGRPEALVHDVVEGPHRWDSTRSVPFMVEALA